MKHASDAVFREHYGPWAVVAGASEGLGAEYAVQLAAKGLQLVLIARRAEKLADLADQLSRRYTVQARILPLDLGEANATPTILEATQDLEIGLLVYNAAFSITGPFWDSSLEEHLQELEVNCRTALALAYSFGQQFLRRQRGGIILMSSLSASQGSAWISNYAATKAYNLVLAEGLWEELRGKGIDVLACCPGATRTPNYVESLTRRKGQAGVSAMTSQAVASETLAALGKQPSVIPGRLNRWAAFLMRRVLPRQAAIQLMGSVLRKMYIQ